MQLCVIWIQYFSICFNKSLTNFKLHEVRSWLMTNSDSMLNIPGFLPPLGHKYRKYTLYRRITMKTHWQLLKLSYNLLFFLFFSFIFFWEWGKFLLFFLESAITTPFVAKKFPETRRMIYSLVNIKALSFPKIAWERKDMYISQQNESRAFELLQLFLCHLFLGHKWCEKSKLRSKELVTIVCTHLSIFEPWKWTRISRSHVSCKH